MSQRALSAELTPSAGSRRGGVAAQRPERPPAPPGSPLRVVAQPDIAVATGAVSAGSAGKLVLSQADHRLGRDLRSTLDVSLAFAPSSIASRAAEPALRQAFARWNLVGDRGRRGYLAAWGDPSSTSFLARLETPLAGALSLMCQEEWRWTRFAWGSERVHASTLDFRQRIGGTLVVQPGVFVTDVRAPNAWRTIGTNVRAEWRGAQFALWHEGNRRSRWSARQLWSGKPLQLILGGQYETRRRSTSRYLIELGFGRSALGIRYFEGHTQRAAVLRLGALQLGISTRPTERRFVLGIGSASLAVARPAQGAPEVGVGFVFRGILRNVARTDMGWRWQPPLGPGALEDPHLRWPGFASALE